jgi:hypothetical protein
MWLEQMNKPFPRLADLSLLSTTTEEMGLVLPETLQAPDLRRLSLHGIGLPKGLSLLSSMISLSTFSFTQIQNFCYFSRGNLFTQLQGLPHLEELSIGFAISTLPSSEGELLPAPIPPVTLPALRRLTFRGEDVHLDNLIAQINTPLLERLSLTLFFDLAFNFMNLTEFIHRTVGSGRLVARVIFNEDGASIDAGPHEQRDIWKLNLRVNCESLDWQIDSATQVCGALGNVLSAIEELTFDLDVDGMPSDWESRLDSMLWHDLLLPFIAVKRLRLTSSLTLSQALESLVGGLALEVLPELQELEVQLDMRHLTSLIHRADKVFSAFVESRKSVGRPVHLLAIPIPGRQKPKQDRAHPRGSHDAQGFFPRAS